MKTVPSLKPGFFLWALLFQLGIQCAAFSQTVLNYQGRVISGGAAFNGTGQFKFAIVSADGSTVYWKNDGTTTASAPATAVSLPVNKGLFSIQLGDASIVNMGTIASSVLSNSGIKLRVWFNDGVKNWQQFSPDQGIVLSSILKGTDPTGAANDQSVSDLALISGEQAKLGLKPISSSSYIEYFTSMNGAYGFVDSLTNAAHPDPLILSAGPNDIPIPIPNFINLKGYRAFQQETVSTKTTHFYYGEQKTFSYQPNCSLKFIYAFIFGTSNSQSSPGGELEATLTYSDNTTETLAGSAYFGYYGTGSKEIFLKPGKSGSVVKNIALKIRSSGQMSVSLCYARPATLYLSARPGFFEPGKQYRAILDYAQGGKKTSSIAVVAQSSEGDVVISTGANWINYPFQTESACNNAKIEVRMAADSSTDETAFDALRGIVILKQ
jgi:hypothetical protein